MADSDKIITITPNTSVATTHPEIKFVGKDNSPMYLRVLDDNSLSFEGTEGQVFSMSPTMSSGDIFSVNDISGVQSMAVNADGTITLNPTNSKKIIVTGGISTPTATSGGFEHIEFTANNNLYGTNRSATFSFRAPNSDSQPHMLVYNSNRAAIATGTTQNNASPTIWLLHDYYQPILDQTTNNSIAAEDFGLASASSMVSSAGTATNDPVILTLIDSGDTNSGDAIMAVGTGTSGGGVLNQISDGKLYFKIDDSGDSIFYKNVGIGTTSPNGNLHISATQPRLYLSDSDEGTGTGDSLLITKSGTISYIYDRDANSKLYLGANDDSDIIVIDGSNARVGIGTTSPDEHLHVEGAGVQKIRIESTDDQAGLELLSDSTNKWVMYSPNGSDDLRFWTDVGDVNVLTLDATNKRVGVGTTAPDTNFHVKGSGVQRIKVESTDNQAGIQLISDSADSWIMYSPDGTDDLRFFTNTGTDADVMTLEGTNKRVGIGTTSPSDKLHVSGNAMVTGELRGGDNRQWTPNSYKLGDASGGNDGNIWFKVCEWIMDGSNYDSFSFHAKVTQRGNATDWHELVIRAEFATTWWTKDFNIHGPAASTAQDTYLMVFDHSSGGSDPKATLYFKNSNTWNQKYLQIIQNVRHGDAIPSTSWTWHNTTTSSTNTPTTDGETNSSTLSPDYYRTMGMGVGGANDTQYRVYYGTTATAMYLDTANQRAGIGTASPSTALDVSGTVNATNLTIGGAQGSDGQVLTSTGSGVAWEAASGGGAVDSIANFSNNRVLTASDADSINGEANLTFDGSGLDVTGTIVSSGTTTSSQFRINSSANRIGSPTTNNVAIFTDSTERLRVNSTGKVGIGTGTIPHESIGYAKFAIEGTNQNAAGPHIQTTTATDNYPLLQILSWLHDNIAINLDSYFNGAWRSSDAGSNYQIYKHQNLLKFRYDSGITAGDALTWETAFAINTGGQLTGHKQEVLTASSGLVLTADQSGAIVIWTGGALTLPSAPPVGTYFEVYNLSGADATVAFGGSDSAHSTQGAGVVKNMFTLKWAYVGSNEWVWSK